MWTTAVALLLACAAFMAYDYVTFREQQIRRLETLADMIGGGEHGGRSRSTTRAAARETLATLTPQASLDAVADPDGRTARCFRVVPAAGPPEAPDRRWHGLRRRGTS